MRRCILGKMGSLHLDAHKWEAGLEPHTSDSKQGPQALRGKRAVPIANIRVQSRAHHFILTKKNDVEDDFLKSVDPFSDVVGERQTNREIESDHENDKCLNALRYYRSCKAKTHGDDARRAEEDTAAIANL